MAAIVVWLDSQDAKLFELKVTGVEERHLHAHGPKHHQNPHGRAPGGHHQEAVSLFKDLTHALEDSTEILILGPGEAKTNFRTYLEKHSPTLAKKIVGLQTVDHPTDNQILALARKFFKAHDLIPA